ncbi:MAG TPA: hypothetical protein VI172_08310 [Candidatus Dormibacteraeota bacterium]|jgi:hypothetical protein
MTKPQRVDQIVPQSYPLFAVYDDNPGVAYAVVGWMAESGEHGRSDYFPMLALLAEDESGTLVHGGNLNGNITYMRDLP